jgi:hypothetical protein
LTGGKITSDRFMNMLVTRGIEQLRFAEGCNDIATIDRAIASLKLLITKRTLTTRAGNWAQELRAATASYNQSPHEHLGMEQPSSVEGNDQLQFELQAQSGKDNDAQGKVSQQVNKKIASIESYRIEAESGRKGLGARSFRPKYQERIRQIEPGQNLSGRYVVDTLGEQTRRERIKPVPTNSTNITQEPTGGNTQSDPAKVAATLEMPKATLGRIVGTKDITTVSRELTEADKIVMRTHRVTATTTFV